MRLRLKFVALTLLLVIATFPNSSSSTCSAEEGNPCYEGCVREEQSCTGGCGFNMSCVSACKEKFRKCEAGCKGSGILIETPNEY